MRYQCSDCGGDVEMVEYTHTDASGTETYDCLNCDSSGEVYFFEGADSPKYYGSVEPYKETATAGVSD